MKEAITAVYVTFSSMRCEYECVICCWNTAAGHYFRNEEADELQEMKLQRIWSYESFACGSHLV
jgi:hypothetical protein